MKLTDLHPYDRNPRQIKSDAMEKLKQSISRDPEFMALRPIVHLPDGAIIGGNQRWRACCELGMDEIPDGWTRNVGDMPEEQWKRFVLVDNSPDGMSGDYDMDILSADYSRDDLSLLGFELAVIDPGGDDVDPFIGEGKVRYSVKLEFDDEDSRDTWMNAIDWSKVKCKREVKP
jgi:hypothetical protein